MPCWRMTFFSRSVSAGSHRWQSRITACNENVTSNVHENLRIKTNLDDNVRVLGHDGRPERVERFRDKDSCAFAYEFLFADVAVLVAEQNCNDLSDNLRHLNINYVEKT